jgi:hypothetical protein
MTAVKFTYKAIKELLEAVFSVRSDPRLYNRDQKSVPCNHDLCLPRLGVCSRQPSTEIAAPAKQSPRTIGNFPRHTPVRDLRMAFKLPYIYDYITKQAGNKQKS